MGREGGCIAFTPNSQFKEAGRQNEDIGIIKIKSRMAHMHSPHNDEGVPWPVERKRTPFSIHLAACPDLIQPKSLLNPNLIPANLQCCFSSSVVMLMRLQFLTRKVELCFVAYILNICVKTAITQVWSTIICCNAMTNLKRDWSEGKKMNICWCRKVCFVSFLGS